MYFLAELNDVNICISIKATKDIIDNKKHVIIESMNNDLLWRKYEDGKWSDEKHLPAPELQLSIEDKINYIYYKQMEVI